MAPGTDISGIGTLKSIDEAARQGYREDFSILDAAESLWKQENFNFNIFDSASIQRMQDRVRQGSYTMKPTDAELSAYIDNLRQNGLDGAVDWSGLTRELEAFQTTTPEELEDGLDYLASRYAAVLDKLERNYSGEELTAQRAKLEEVYQAGKSGMIEGYTQLLQDYRAEIDGASSCGRNEVTLGLNLAMADMKAETMISKGLVSDSMAALLRGSRAQGHENALAALNRALAQRESHRVTGEPKGTYAPVDSTVFRGIYDAVMSAYCQNGGDAAKAIQAGASAGEKLTAQAAARAPEAARWGVSMKHYLQEFYKAPEERKPSRLDTQIHNLLIQAGQTPRSQCSTYQKYVNSWQDFLTSIGGGVNIRA